MVRSKGSLKFIISFSDDEVSKRIELAKGGQICMATKKL